MGSGKGSKAVISNTYKFIENDKSTAVLDTDGKLSLLPDTGMEVFASWKDYVKEKLGEPPTNGGEDDIVEQLSIMLGRPEVVDVKVSGVDKRPKPVEKEEGEDNVKNATATKKAVAPAKKAVAKKAAEPKVQNPCICGCGTMVNKNFAPGHDARVHGWAKKIERGEMKFSDINTKDSARAVKFIKTEMGVTQGVAAK